MTSERLEAELVACAAAVNAAKARFVALLTEFVAREGWVAWGCVSAVQWLSWHCGLGRVAASEHLRVARALADLPAVGAGFASGALSWSKVRAVTRVAAAHTDGLWAAWAATATGAQLDQLVAVARRVSADDVERQEAKESLGRRVDERDGSVVYTWRVPAEIAAGIDAAIEAGLAPEKGVPVARSRSQALTRLALGADRPVAEVIIHLDAATGTTVSEHGLVVPHEVAGVAACDGHHSVVVHQPDGSIAVSDRQRAPTERVRRALRARDRQCRMPGCHLQGSLEVHHIHHYHRGGTRHLANLVRLCAAHHRIVHRHDLHLAWAADGGLEVTLPDNTPFDRSPQPAAGPVAPIPTTWPTAPWDGRPLDAPCVEAALISSATPGPGVRGHEG